MRFWYLVLLAICVNTAAAGQEMTPPLLIHAARCLEAKGFLYVSKSEAATFGYFLDSASYPQQNALYVVEFANSSRSKGWVFTVFLSNSDHREVFDIQNNARFAPSKNGIHGIDFPDPPLGGGWTQEHIVLAIKKIQKGAIFSIPDKDLRETSPGIQCESYAESK